MDVITFKFHTMSKKYKGFMDVLLGVDWNERLDVNPNGSLIDIRIIRDNFPVAVLDESKLVGDFSKMEVRDWCQAHFGDRWIYDYNNFYFHNQQDANWFKLRWG